MQRLVAWERQFEVWQYSVSHSTLLLRSIDSEGRLHRIDVVFRAVGLMRLQPDYARLEISEADGAERDGLLGLDSTVETLAGLYLLNGGMGYVLARACAWHEDLGDHHAPSKFGPLRGTE